MRPHLLVLTSLLLLAAGCRHANIPSLPASHGHLTESLERYRRPPSQPLAMLADNYSPSPLADARDSQGLVVEPGQARGVFEEAVQVLRGEPSAQEVRQAADDLRAACEAGLADACRFLLEEYGRPKKLSGPMAEITKEFILKRAFASVVIRCRLGVDTVLRDCEALEHAPYGLTESALAAISASKFQPVTLAGHPIEVPYTFLLNYTTTSVPLSDDIRLQWARARAANFPHSAPAWARLASELARQAPEDRWYPEALRHLLQLSPSNWWAANELAWLHVQAGRYAEAAPLAKWARSWEQENSYVLETSAAVLAATGQCEQALEEQRQAVAKLPAEWPQEERERFARTLEQYQRQCAPPG